MAAEPEKSDAGPERGFLADPPSETGKRNPGISVRPLSPGMDARWKAVFHEKMQPRALKLQELRVEKLHRVKLQEKKVEKKEPADGLSREWFNDESTTLETRAYLLDKLLPTLVPGMEKLLRAAERKKALETAELEPRVLDPINFLGEYLMRHNPSYEISAIPNPYVRGMKAVTEELKTQVPETTMHKLAQMKMLVKEKREKREQVEKIKGDVKDVRKETLAMQFREWTQDVSGHIPLELIQSALKSFLEVATPAPADAGIYARPLEAVGTLSVKVNQEEFSEYLLSYIKNFTSDMFEQLLQHLLQCANNTREAIRHDIWRRMFLQLFFDCDHGKVGLLDRLRILSLLETFYDNSAEFSKKGYQDPRKWPIVELDDIDLTEFWGNMEDDEQIVSEEPSLQLRLSEQAMVLNLMLKDILSEVELPIPKTTSVPLATAIQEEARLEQKTSTAGEGSKVILVTASQDAAEMPATELGPSRPGVQEEQAPAAEAVGGPAANEAVVPAAAEGAVPEAFQVHPPEVLVGGVEGDARQGRSDPAALAEMALSLQETLDQELGPDQEGDLEDLDVAAQETGEDEAVMQEEPGDTVEPGSEAVTQEEPGDTVEPGSEAVTQEEPGDTVEPGSEAVTQEEPGSGVQPRASTEGQPAAGTSRPPAGKSKDLLSLPAPKASKTIKRTPQLIYGERWSGDFQTADLSFKYTDYGKEIREDWNNENTRFPDLRMNMIEIQARGPPSSTSAFDKHSLNLPQFVQLMEMFVGEETTLPNMKRLVEFVKEGYVQTEKEKIEQLKTVHHDSFLVRKQLLLAALFEKWDNECSGFLDLEEVDAVLSTFKEGMEQESLNKAKLQLPIPQWHPSGVVKLSPKDFHAYIELVVSELTGDEDEVLDNVVEFLMTAVEQTHTERLRGNVRRKWLTGIQHMAMIHGGALEPVYQAVFKALCRDADAHGDSKKISANIALLEYNLLDPERGDILLRYVACTEDDAPYVLNQTLFMDMEGISFAAALDGKPIHVPRVQLHGNIHFWNYSRPKQERKGSFLVLPLEDVRRRVFGVLGLDTLRDENEKTIFVPHEIRFYQGIANSFSIAYHHIRTQESIIQVIVTAVGWLSTRTANLQTFTAYFMEPGENRMFDYTLRKVMTSDLKGQAETHRPPAPVLSRKDNIFRDYLFKCIDCAVVVTTYVHEEHHVAIPLRTPMGQAIAVFDLNLGHCQKLPSYEQKDLQKMLKMAQAASYEILKEDSGDLDPCYVLEAEYVGDWRRGGVLFYRFMLQDLQSCIWNLDPWLSFGEITCFERPPVLLHTILKCVLLILYPQMARTGELEDWNYCIQKLDGELIENICYFDPTAAYVEVQPDVLNYYFQSINRRSVWKFGSTPVEYLYNWTHTCLSLIELAEKLKHRQNIVTPSSALLTPTLSRSLKSSHLLAARGTSFA
ncbi:EF-hand calcium-binding domain-containing protein 5 [Elgaria multicarinata webbii]|uniref:EF-hand calcium-binding domain-containing protein 5 n=1 Tax=Elgaria multicarinata webbii TaxID=159646 RepID=UPI002FCD1B28